MRVLVISSCTKRKLVRVAKPLTLEDFKDPERRIAREKELSSSMREAAEMYTGDQHVEVMRGVKGIRERFGTQAVCVRIISAGYGLVSEDRPIAPYDVTFSNMKREAAAWARCLHIADDVRETIRGWPLAIFLLGDDYFAAIDPPISPSDDGQRLLFVAKPRVATRLSAIGVTWVPAGEHEVRDFRRLVPAGTADRPILTTNLKGFLFEWYARCLCVEGKPLWERTCQDPTADTFMEAVRKGVNIEPS
jgi:hypothetical protein